MTMIRQTRTIRSGIVICLAGFAFNLSSAFACGGGSIGAYHLSVSTYLYGLGVSQSRDLAVVAGGDKDERRVSLLDARTGALRSAITLTGALWGPGEFGPVSTLAVDDANARAYINTYDHITSSGPTVGYVNVIDTRHATLLNTVSSRLPISSRVSHHLWGMVGLPVAMTVDSRTGRLFVVNTTWPNEHPKGSVTVINGYTGSVVGEVFHDQAPNRVVVNDQTGLVYVVGQPTNNNGIADGSAYLGVLDGTSGQLLHRITLPYSVYDVAIAPRLGRLLLLGTNQFKTPSAVNYLTVVDTYHNALVDTVPLGPGSYTSMATDEAANRVFVSSTTIDTEGHAHTIIELRDARRGTLLHAVSLAGGSIQMVVDTVYQHVFVAMQRDSAGGTTAAGSVIMLDASSGAVLHTEDIGDNPVAATADSRAERLYVVVTGPRAADYPERPPQGNGSLVTLDLMTGHRVKTVSVGVNPTDIALTRETGRVLVLSRGGAVPDKQSRIKWAERFVSGMINIISST